MLYEIYDDIYVVKRIKCIVFDGWVISLVWIAPTQFVKSSNLSQVVVVADKVRTRLRIQQHWKSDVGLLLLIDVTLG